jgi:hypothetical protein
MTKSNKNQSDEYFLVDLPNSNAILVVGVLSILSCFFMGLIGIILGFIGVKLYKRPHELYKLAPELYTKESYKNLRAGYTMSIVGLAVSSLFVLFILLYVFVFGSLFALL